MTIAQAVLGIDVSGRSLDVFALPAGRAKRFANDRKGIAGLLAWAATLDAFVVLEATAPWDQALLRALEQAGRPFHRANPTPGRCAASGSSPAAASAYATRSIWPPSRHGEADVGRQPTNTCSASAKHQSRP